MKISNTKIGFCFHKKIIGLFSSKKIQASNNHLITITNSSNLMTLYNKVDQRVA